MFMTIIAFLKLKYVEIICGNTVFVMLLTLVDSYPKQRSILQDLQKQNLSKSYPYFLDLVDSYYFQCAVSFLSQSLIQL